jgi:hypothetical protein
MGTYHGTYLARSQGLYLQLDIRSGVSNRYACRSVYMSVCLSVLLFHCRLSRRYNAWCFAEYIYLSREQEWNFTTQIRLCKERVRTLFRGKYPMAVGERKATRDTQRRRRRTYATVRLLSRYSAFQRTIAPVPLLGSSSPGPKWRVRTSEHQNQGQLIDSCFARATEHLVRRLPHSLSNCSIPRVLSADLKKEEEKATSKTFPHQVLNARASSSL